MRPTRTLVVVLGVLALWPALSAAPGDGAPASRPVSRPAALLDEAVRLERDGRWRDAISRYQDLARLEPERADLAEAIERCRRQTRIEARARAQADLDFVAGRRGPALYEEVLERISGNFVVEVEMSPLVARGLGQCLLAAENPAFRRAFGAHLEARAGGVEAWRARLRALEAWMVGRRLTPGQGAQVLGQVLDANHDTAHFADQGVVLEMIHGAVEGLDSHSGFLDPPRYKALRTEIDGEFVGLGVRIGAENGRFLVTDPVVGGPAEKAGVRARDRLLAVDGHSLDGFTLEEVGRLLQGPVNAPVVLEVEREGEPRVLAFTIRRDRVVLRSVTDGRLLSGEPRIGYLHLVSFQKSTAAELEEALKRLERGGMGALVLDLRGNPGGVLEAGVDVASAFLREGVVVTTRGRAPGQTASFRASGERTHPAYPLAVLVDEMSASASEIVAGALQDHGRATLVGSRTYGKGSIQSLFTLGRGDVALRLTTARFYAPGGRTFDGAGLRPDLEVPLEKGVRFGDVDDEGAGLDAPLARAVRLLRTRLAGRPAADRARWDARPMHRLVHWTAAAHCGTGFVSHGVNAFSGISPP